MPNVEHLKIVRPTPLRSELIALQRALVEAQLAINAAARAQIEQMDKQRLRNDAVQEALESGDVDMMEALRAELYPHGALKACSA